MLNESPRGLAHRAGRTDEEWRAYCRERAVEAALADMRDPRRTLKERATFARKLLVEAMDLLSPLAVAECEAVIAKADDDGTSNGGRCRQRGRAR